MDGLWGAGLLGEFPEYFHQSDVSRDETACFRSCIRPSYSSTSFPAWAAIETRSKLRLVEDSEQMMTVRAIRSGNTLPTIKWGNANISYGYVHIIWVIYQNVNELHCHVIWECFCNCLCHTYTTAVLLLTHGTRINSCEGSFGTCSHEIQ